MTDMTVDLRALAARPTPTVDLNLPNGYLVETDPQITTARHLLDEAARRYAALEAGEAAEMLAKAFPGAHRVVFEVNTGDAGTDVDLCAVWDAAGVMLWHVTYGSDWEEHPDAVARAEAEAYGGPVLPKLERHSRAAIEARLELAEEYGREYFTDAHEGSQFQWVNRESVEQTWWYDGDVRELTVPEALEAAKRQITSAAVKASPAPAGAAQPYTVADGFAGLGGQLKERTLMIDGITTEAMWRDLERALGLARYELGRWKEWAADRPKLLTDQYDLDAAATWAQQNGLAYEDERAIRYEPEARAAARLNALAEELGITESDLDELVHELHSEAASQANNDGAGPADEEQAHEELHGAAERAASQVNNDGLPAQVDFLIEALGAADAEARLRAVAAETPKPANS